MDAEESRLAAGSDPVLVGTLLEVVRDVVATTAPAELPLVVALSRFDEAQIERRLVRGGKGSEPLGFGLEEVSALAAPIVWTAVQGVVNQMATTTADSLDKRIGAAARRIFRRRAPAAQLPHFKDSELARIHRGVLELALERGMDPGSAKALADSVVGRLEMSAVNSGTAGNGA